MPEYSPPTVPPPHGVIAIAERTVIDAYYTGETLAYHRANLLRACWAKVERLASLGAPCLVQSMGVSERASLIMGSGYRDLEALIYVTFDDVWVQRPIRRVHGAPLPAGAVEITLDPQALRSGHDAPPPVVTAAGASVEPLVCAYCGARADTVHGLAHLWTLVTLPIPWDATGTDSRAFCSTEHQFYYFRDLAQKAEPVHADAP